MRPIPLAVLTLVHEFEGNAGHFEATRTLDPVGNPEIGYGHKLSGPDDPLWNVTLDQAAADQLAMKDLALVATGVCDALGGAVNPLTDNQYAALIDFTFNLGVGNFTDSTLCRLVKIGDYAGAADQFGRWIHAGGQIMQGLIRRRVAERNLFLS